MITGIGLSPSLDVTYTIDKLRPGQIHRPRTVLALPGGKSLNAVRAATTLGARVRALTPLGGFTGARIGASLDALGVDVVSLSTEDETRECVSVFDSTTGSMTEFYEPAGPMSSELSARLSNAIAGLETDWIALSGSIPMGSAVEELLPALAAAAARGQKVAIDSHGPALGVLIGACSPAVVKVNRFEASDLLGPGTARELASSLAAMVAPFGVAIVTDGAAGAVAVGPAGAWHVAPPTAGRFSVGSGDCFLGGLLTGLDTPEGTLETALVLATAAAAANTVTPGAAIFDPHEVERLRSLVVLTPLR